MGFQHVAFLPCRATLSTTFLKHCGRGESLGSTTCHKSVVEVSMGMLSVRYFCSYEASLSLLNFIEIMMLSQR